MAKKIDTLKSKKTIIDKNKMRFLKLIEKTEDVIIRMSAK